TKKYLNKFLNNTNLLPISMNHELPEGAYIVNEEMHLKWKNEEMEMNVEDFAVKGKHNQYNTMAAGISSAVLGIRKEKIRDAIQTFEGLEHRMFSVATVRGVEFINDSKATNVNSTWYALESMTKPVILILGGVDKGNDYSFIKDLIKEKVKGIVCLGVDNSKIHEALGKEVQLMINTESAKDAVQAAFHFADKGDVVLLSPACASFDLFKNYEDRGNQFIEAVKDL
ncbi:MAG: cyanophycin synthetase, partial [Ginsengibacter sp.]